MNYQHAYHVGNVADVFKHIILIQLLKNLHKKTSAFTYFETHAGNALYDLQDVPAQKTLEHHHGIGTLWSNQNYTNPAIAEYLQIIKSLNPNADTLQFYPGSNLFARQYLRPQDRAIFCELHPNVYQNLRRYFRQDKQVHVHQRDGYEALLALLPPKTPRGLVLIDPPFEVTNEFAQVINALENLQIRWLSGMTVIWFPIKQYEIILAFYAALKKLSFNNILATELWTKAEMEDNTLKGSGLVIINPPWQFDEMLAPLLPDLAKALHITEQENNKVTWLVKT